MPLLPDCGAPRRASYGQPRGRTPLSVNDLRPGSYTVTLILREHDTTH